MSWFDVRAKKVARGPKAAIRQRRCQTTGRRDRQVRRMAPQASGERQARTGRSSAAMMATQSAGEAERLAREGLGIGVANASDGVSIMVNVPVSAPLCSVNVLRSSINRLANGMEHQQREARAAGLHRSRCPNNVRNLGSCRRANRRKAFGSPCRAPSGRAATRSGLAARRGELGVLREQQPRIVLGHRASARPGSRGRRCGSFGRPDCCTPSRSPAPRSRRSSSAMRKPSSVARMISSRARAVSPSGGS